MLLNDEEKQCVRSLAEQFEKGEAGIRRADAIERLGISGDAFDPLMKKMEHLEAVKIIGSTTRGAVIKIRILAGAVELSRSIDAKAAEDSIAPDFVEQILGRLRRNPFVGYTIVIGAVALALLTLIAHSLSILEILGWLN